MLMALRKERQSVQSAALASNGCAVLGSQSAAVAPLTAHGLVICLSTSEQKHRCRRKRILSAIAEN